jgi:hypothetical protein
MEDNASSVYEIWITLRSPAPSGVVRLKQFTLHSVIIIARPQNFPADVLRPPRLGLYRSQKAALIRKPVCVKRNRIIPAASPRRGPSKEFDACFAVTDSAKQKAPEPPSGYPTVY